MAFLHFVLLDEDGVHLCGFDGALAPVPPRPAPDTLVEQAAHFVASGKLPSRSRLLSAAGWGSVLSTSGDLVSAHVTFPRDPEDREIRSAYAAVLAFEGAFGLHLDEPRQGPARMMGARGHRWNALRHPPGDLALPEAPTVLIHCKMGLKGGRVTGELHLHNNTAASSRRKSGCAQLRSHNCGSIAPPPMAYLRVGRRREAP